MSLSLEKNEACLICEFQENLGLLREIYFFSGLPLEALKVFAYLCVRETFKPGEYLFRQDEDDGQAFYLIDGDVQLVQEVSGVENEIRTFAKETFIGGMALLGNLPRLFSLKAATTVVCLIMTREKFSSAIEQFPDLMPKIVKAIIGSIRKWENRFFIEHASHCKDSQQYIGVTLI
jgi:CRP-like cAMP-binding protein